MKESLCVRERERVSESKIVRVRERESEWLQCKVSEKLFLCLKQIMILPKLSEMANEPKDDEMRDNNCESI